MPSYYTIIDGLRYKRALLEADRQATAKPGDGRYSVADADHLADLLYAGSGNANQVLTQVERDTVALIRKASKWTAAADRRFLSRVPDAPALKPWQIIGGGTVVQPDFTAVAELAKPILATHGVPELTVKIDKREVDAQAAAFAGSVDFAAALDCALASFLHDGERTSSPVMLAQEQIAGEGTMNGFTDADRAVQDLLNRPTATLALVSRADMVQAPNGDPNRVFPPEEGEKPQQSWLFSLRVDDGDILHWAIVDRNAAQPTYNYGFN